MRAVAVARLALGGTLLLNPRLVLAAIAAPDRDDPPVILVARVLGGRLLLQVAVETALRGRVQGGRLQGVGAAVEGAHAVSMVPLVAWSPRHRRSAATSASLALGLAVLDVRDRGHHVSGRIAHDARLRQRPLR